MRRRSHVPPPIVKVPVHKLPSYPRRSRFRRSRFTGTAWVLAGAVLLIVAGGGVVLYRMMNPPAELTGSLAPSAAFSGPTVRGAGRDRSDGARLRQHAAWADRRRRVADRQRARGPTRRGWWVQPLPAARVDRERPPGRHRCRRPNIRDRCRHHSDPGPGRPPGDDGDPRESVGLGQSSHPPAGPRLHRAGPHQRRGARHQGRVRARRVRQQRARWPR